MRDVSAKVASRRTAVARSVIRVSPQTIALIRENRAPKGDPLPIARTAAILAAKNTPNLIPYCHSVPLDWVAVDFDIGDDRIEAVVTVVAIDRTGVEMEALTGAAVAALNLYDLLKPVDDAMEIEAITLLSKTGGKSAFPRPGGARAAVLVASDRSSRGEREDVSGVLLAELLEAEGVSVVARELAPDEMNVIAGFVEKWAMDADFVFVTGGTGIGPRDTTPEAIAPLLDCRLMGVEEHLRAYGQRRLPTAMFSRSVVGMLGPCVVVALPGSPGAVRDGVAALFPYLLHALDMVRGGSHEP